MKFVQHRKKAVLTFVGLLITSSVSAYQIVNSGITYELSTVTGFMANKTLLESQPWYGNGTKAGSFADSAKASGYLTTWTQFAHAYALDAAWVGGAYVAHATANPCCESTGGAINIDSANLMNWAIVTRYISAADTQSSLTTLSGKIRSYFNATVMSSNYANMNTYDCNLFDKNNMCISAGGRYTNIDNPSSNHSAAVVTLGYKVSPNIRIGGFLDQSVNNNTPTGINVSNKNPMMGAFAVWNKNADGLGYQIKIANAYQDKDVRSTRDAFGETGEAGTGKTNLNTQSYVGELSYAFNYKDSTIVRPYFAMRYTNIKQDAYTETGVDNPLSYAKLGDRSTTALMGSNLITHLHLEQT